MHDLALLYVQHCASLQGMALVSHHHSTYHNNNAYRLWCFRGMLYVFTATKAFITATTEGLWSTNHSTHDSSPVPAISRQPHHCCHEELFTTRLGEPAPCSYYCLSVHVYHSSVNGASNGRLEPPHALSRCNGTITATRHKRICLLPHSTVARRYDKALIHMLDEAQQHLITPSIVYSVSQKKVAPLQLFAIFSLRLSVFP